MNDDTISVDEQDEIEAAQIEAGPSVDELSNSQDGGTGAAGANDGAGDGDGEPKAPTHHRVRIEHADGSRSWHVEQASTPELAETLARGRDLGTVVRVEPLETDDAG